MPNVRSWWAISQVAIKDNAAPPTGAVADFRARYYATGALASGVNEVNNKWEVPRGLQECGVDTTFNLEEVFQIGQAEVYEQSERQPDVSLNLSKVLDGTKPLWLMVTNPAQGNDLIARTADYPVDVTLQLYQDTKYRATGAPLSIMTGSGMFVSSVTYTFPVDGMCTEDVTLIGNDKVWGTLENISGVSAGNGGSKSLVNFGNDQNGGHPDAPEGLPSGVFGHDGTTSVLVEGGASEVAGPPDRFGIIVVGSGIQRREDVDIRRSVLPQDIPGVKAFAASGINAAYVNGGFGANGPGTESSFTQLIGDANTDHIIEHLQNITVSIDLGRDDIFELGSLRPFSRVPNFPLDVTASFEVLTSQGDFVDAESSPDIGNSNTSATNTVIIRTVDGLQVDLGDQNRLESVNMGDGGAGGGNRTITYSYKSFNVWNVSHDYFQPNHRIIVFNTGNSRFNTGAPNYRRQDVGIF
jgi:hypothetical protein